MKRSLADSFRNAFVGIRYAWRTQRNLRIHGVVAAAVVAAILFLRLPPAQSAALLLAVALVLCAELINTAVEVVVDHLVGSEHRSSARVAKDVAAAAVLVAAVGAAVVGAVILLPRLR